MIKMEIKSIPARGLNSIIVKPLGVFGIKIVSCESGTVMVLSQPNGRN